MSGRAFYQGTALQLVDRDKKRVAVPATIRHAITRNSPSMGPKDLEITIATHPKSVCLIGYDEGYLARRYEKAQRLEEMFLAEKGVENFNFMREASGGGEPVGLDSSGRFVLPGNLAKEVGIVDHAFFYGSMDVFEIWNPAALMADPDVSPQLKRKLQIAAEEKGLQL